MQTTNSISALRIVSLSAAIAWLTACSVSQPPAKQVEHLPLAPEIASGYRAGLEEVHATKHMAAAANPLAAEAGREMLRAGGSAIDAAIAMQAVLTLVEPQASGIGGGAFIMYWDGAHVQAFDGRETAPARADGNLFLRADGTPMPFTDAQIGGRSVGVPGVLRALKLAHDQHGKLPWRDLFKPAIRLAQNGFPISKRLHTQIAADQFILTSPELSRYFLGPDGKAWPVGTKLKNPELAKTLQVIADQGADAFYSGEIARAIVDGVSKHSNPGVLSLTDLHSYVAKERVPVCGDYKAWKICGMPPPSSGGVAVLQTLGILEHLQRKDERFNLAAMKPKVASPVAGYEPSPLAVHLVAEAERLAYADRAMYLADSDFVPVNVRGLTDQAYFAARADLITEQSMGRAEAGNPPGQLLSLAPDRSPLRVATSQVAAVDADGNAISMTTSVEAAFGSHVMVKGFVLNNQLTDFSFVSSENGKPVANRVEAGKRPRSSMAPTLVFEQGSGKFLATIGSPGGSQIIEYVNKALVGVLDWNLDPQTAINLPNFGSRNVGTEVEQGLVSDHLIQQLQVKGHVVTPIEMTSGTQIIMKTASGWSAGADPRREGEALGD